MLESVLRWKIMRYYEFCDVEIMDILETSEILTVENSKGHNWSNLLVLVNICWVLLDDSSEWFYKWREYVKFSFKHFENSFLTREMQNFR